MRNRNAIASLAMTAMVLAASACGGGNSTDPAPTYVLLASGTVTSAGGTVSVTGGPSVQVPAGALSADTVITISESSAQAPAGAAGKVYALGPAGATFARPVTVSLPIRAGTTAGAIWTDASGSGQFTSLPSTVSGNAMTAEVSHFSIFVPGPVDFSGTWAGTVSYTVRNADGSTGTPGQTMQTRDVTQNVGEIAYAITNGTGNAASCSGSVVGDVLTATCTIRNLQENCSATYEPGGSVVGTTWNTTSTYTWQGTCPSAGATVTVAGSTLTKQAGPPMNVSGTYSRTSSYTMTGPGKPPTSGTSTGTAVRTQATGSSAVRTAVTMVGGATYTCLGNVVGTGIQAACYGSNGAVTYNVSAIGTVSVGPPFTIVTHVTQSISNDPSGFTAATATLTDVRQ